MTALTRLSTSATLAQGLAAGAAGIFAAGSAFADTDRTDCVGNNCVHVHCYDDSDTCTQTTNYAVRGHDSYTIPSSASPNGKPTRYACDSDGFNCHWTRSYYLGDFDKPVYDPGMSP